MLPCRALFCHRLPLHPILSHLQLKKAQAQRKLYEEKLALAELRRAVDSMQGLDAKLRSKEAEVRCRGGTQGAGSKPAGWAKNEHSRQSRIRELRRAGGQVAGRTGPAVSSAPPLRPPPLHPRLQVIAAAEELGRDTERALERMLRQRATDILSAVDFGRVISGEVDASAALRAAQQQLEATAAARQQGRTSDRQQQQQKPAAAAATDEPAAARSPNKG